jgi:diacylglycerol kinase family enzyme
MGAWRVVFVDYYWEHPTMNITVIYNPKSGQNNDLEHIKKVFAEQGANPTYLPITSRQLRRHVKSQLGSSRAIIVAAGGDGTVNFVANLVHGSKAKLGVIASGTLNHFAKDVGLPLDIPKAVSVILGGTTRLIDAAQVNKKIFINNSSIGLYPRSLRARKQYDGQIGKWPAAILGFIKVLVKPRRYRATFTLDGKQLTRRTPFVFIGNNDYHLNKPPFSRRDKMDEGILGVYITKATHAFGVIRMFAHALFTKKRRTNDFEIHTVQTFTITTRRHRKLHVAYDGEVETLATPLVYTSLPKSLRVLVP